jgi:hypothetical protein
VTVEEAERRSGLAHDPQGGALPLARWQALGETARGDRAAMLLAWPSSSTWARRFSTRPPSTAWRANSVAGSGLALAIGAVGVTVAYGVARPRAWAFSSFATRSSRGWRKRALRQLALETFQHIHALSLRYHITRKTGGLSAGSSSAA